MAWYEPNREWITKNAQKEALRIVAQYHGDVSLIRGAFEKHRDKLRALDDRKKCYNQDVMTSITEAYLRAIEMTEPPELSTS